MPITIERVDFVPIPSQDRERSKAFYTETLRCRWSAKRRPASR
jgi:hypothetical protein